MLSTRSGIARPAWVALAGGVVAVAVTAGVIWYWTRPPASSSAPVGAGTVQARAAVDVPRVRFTDVTERAGIRFRHTNGAFGKKLLPETMGSGVAFFDYDRDGWPDLLFVNSCYWPGHEDPKAPPPTMALYRNNGDGKGTFTDVTRDAGLAVTFYGMGVTVADYDNDGWPDVFLTGVGGNHLFRSEPGGSGSPRRFTDVTTQAGVGGPGGWPAGRSDFLKHDKPVAFSSSAAFLDYDLDGRLDLFVCNYVTWSPDTDVSQPFTLAGLGRAYGPPTSFEGASCWLYRNRGDGRFEDVTQQAKIPVVTHDMVSNRDHLVGKSLGVIVCDADDDGWPDVVVANDTVKNFFFHNRGDGTFQERGLELGVALVLGQARGAMGIDWGEYRPGRHALLIANFSDEPSTFLRLDNPKELRFSDVAVAEGIAGPSRPPLKFGAFFFDYDLDGRQDLLTANGHLEPDISRVQPQTYEQPAQLFWNTGQRRRGFEPVTAEAAGSDLFKPLVGRGCAYADFDGDGDLDVVLTSNGGAPLLLRNDGETGHHWLRLALEGDGQGTNRSAIGAKVTVEAGGVAQQREVCSARGYLSQSELVLTFGLGTATKVDRVTVRWPGKEVGAPQVVENVAVDRVHTIRQAAAK